MILNKLMLNFSKKFPSFIRKTPLERDIVLNQLIRKFSSFIPSLNNNLIYSEIRSKILEVFKDIKFNCYRCNPSCCMFNEIIYYSEEFGIYNEDYELIRANNLDVTGLIKDRNEDQNIFLKEILKSINNDLEMTRIINNLTGERISEINQTLKKSFGIDYTLKLIKTDTLVYCYYYDLDKRTCKLHPFKPLLCLTYPLRILNNLNQVGTSVNDDCNYMIKIFDKVGMDKFKSYLLTLKSYWEYQILVFLFFIKKGRFKYNEERKKYLQHLDFCFEDLIKMFSK